MTTSTHRLITALAIAAALAAPRVTLAQASAIGSSRIWGGGGGGAVAKAINISHSARDFAESFPPLAPDDSRFDPDYFPPGMPEVPISCAPDSECQQCYDRAQRDLNFIRVQFEKMRALYDATTTMAKNAIAFGDDVSSIHGMMGLAWQTQRRGIQKSVDHLGQTYDGKYREFLAILERSLKSIDACEWKHFDTVDWYNRFGFIYYQFMEARYNRH